MITGFRVILDFVRDCNLNTLLKWRNSEPFLRFCTSRRNMVTLDEFKVELSADFSKDRFCQMIIFKKSTGEALGTIYCYNLSKQDGYAFVTIFMADDSKSIGYGAEAFALFCNHLFDLIPELHKIYAEVYGYNLESMSCLKNAGFVEEGRFKEHRLHNSKRYDLVRFAFFRRDLVATKQRLKILRSKT